MVINVNIKQLSKKGRKIKPLPFVYEKIPETVEDFIRETIRIMYESYMDRLKAPKDYCQAYSKEEIEDMAQMGEVTLGFVYGDDVPDLDSAIETALLAYKDGLVRLFIGDKEAGELCGRIELKDKDEVTFIRLTMLAGRMW